MKINGLTPLIIAPTLLLVLSSCTATLSLKYRTVEGGPPEKVVNGYRVSLIIENDPYEYGSIGVDSLCVGVDLEYLGQIRDSLILDSILRVTIDSVCLGVYGGRTDFCVGPPTDAAREYAIVSQFVGKNHLVGPSRRFEEIYLPDSIKSLDAIVYLSFFARKSKALDGTAKIPFHLVRVAKKGGPYFNR